MPGMDYSVVIPSTGKRKCLVTLVEAVKQQSIEPSQIIVVSPLSKGQILGHGPDTLQGIEIVVCQREDAASQLNIGSDIARGEVVFFFDDDCVPARNYCELLMDIFRRDRKGEIGGVGGVIANEGREKGSILHKIFGIDFESYGKVPDNCVNITVPGTVEPGKIVEVDWLQGGNCAYRKGVLCGMKRSSFFKGYGYYTDVEYSMRVGEKYRLVVRTDARLEHWRTPGGRGSKYNMAKMRVYNRHYVYVNRVMRREEASRFRYAWATIGIPIIGFASGLLRGKLSDALSSVFGSIAGVVAVLAAGRAMFREEYYER